MTSFENRKWSKDFWSGLVVQTSQGLELVREFRVWVRSFGGSGPLDQWKLWKKHFPAFEYLGERQVQKWKWAVNLNDLKWRIKSLWPWSSIRLFKRFLCNFYFTTLPLIRPVKFGININCTWSRWAKHLYLEIKKGSTPEGLHSWRAPRTVRENLSIEKGPLTLQNTHFVGN